MKRRYGVVDASVPMLGGVYPTFGKPPFADVNRHNPLYGTRVMFVPENEIVHAASLGLLPEWNRYWSHVVPHGQKPGSPASLASSALRRLSRALLLSERARKTTLGPPETEVGDELLELVTLAFVHLMGAFDALAQVTAAVTGVKLRGQAIGWNKPPFLNSIAGLAPELAELFADGTISDRSLDAISRVRNTIHKQMPDPAQAGTTRDDGGNDDVLLIFERGAHDELLDALDAAGWSKFVFEPSRHPESLREARRVEIGGVIRTEDFLFMRPSNLFACGLRDSVSLLNAIMSLTPVERLGKPTELLDPANSFYPLSLQRYAVDKLRLTHLANHLEPLPDIEGT